MRIIGLFALLGLGLGCRPPYPHTPLNRGTSTTVEPDTEKVYRAKGKMRFINKSRPGGPSGNFGSLEGRLVDDHKEPLIGCTVVATSPALVGEQVVITDENGKFFIDKLPPGKYQTTYYYNNASFGNPVVHIQAGRITVEDVVDVPANVGSRGHLL